MAVADRTVGRRGDWSGRGGNANGQKRSHRAALAATLRGQRGGRLSKDATRPPGRKPLTARRIKQVANLTLNEEPPDATRWSERTMVFSVKPLSGFTQVSIEFGSVVIRRWWRIIEDEVAMAGDRRVREPLESPKQERTQIRTLLRLLANVGLGGARTIASRHRPGTFALKWSCPGSRSATVLCTKGEQFPHWQIVDNIANIMSRILCIS
jgi:hypothetical protein